MEFSILLIFFLFLIVIGIFLIIYSTLLKIKNNKIFVTLIPGLIFIIVGVILFSLIFIGLSSVCNEKIVIASIFNEEPPDYTNISLNEMSQFPSLEKSIENNKSIKISSDKEWSLLWDKFDDYEFYIKYNNEYYPIRLAVCD